MKCKEFNHIPISRINLLLPVVDVQSSTAWDVGLEIVSLTLESHPSTFKDINHLNNFHSDTFQSFNLNLIMIT